MIGEPKCIALIDFSWVGHHPGFFRLYCRCLLASGHRVIAFCPRPEEVRQWFPTACQKDQLLVHQFTDEVHGHRWKRKIPQLANLHRFQQSARRLAAWEAQTKQRIEMVLFACLYQGIAPLGGTDAVFPYRWTGLLLDSGCVRLPKGPARWWRYRGFDPLALFRARGCASLATLDTFIHDELNRRTGKPVHVLPDAVDSTPPRLGLPLAEMLHARAAGRPIVACFGQFARRKGVLGFLRLAEACQHQSWFFVWAGEAEEGTFSKKEWGWIQRFLAAGPANCWVEFGRVNDEADFNALVALSEVIYLCYHGHPGSSSMIGKAAAFDKRVLVSTGYCMADQARRYDLGLAVPEDDPTEMAAALHRLLTRSQELPTPCFAAYREDQSEDRFAKVVAAMVAREESAPPIRDAENSSMRSTSGTKRGSVTQPVPCCKESTSSH